jgi:hypothetical protein
MRKVIIINGTGEDGKDTFINFVMDYSVYSNVDIFNFSSIDIIKKVAFLLGWEGQKDDKSRKFLHDLKMVSTEYNNFPNQNLIDKILDLNLWFTTEDKVIFFVHIREPEEIEKFKTEIKRLGFPVITLLIKRKTEEQKHWNNYADASVEMYDYDYVVNNISLDNLKSSAEKFFKEITENDSQL